MRILIHGLNFHPEMIGIGKYTGELAAWLAESGHEVRVVTSPPYYPDWKIQLPYKPCQYKSETRQGILVIRCPLWVPKKPSGLTRVLHLLSFSLSSFPALLAQVSWKPNVVINISPTLFSAPFSSFVARCAKAKSWLHIQDFELDAAVNLGMINSGNLIKQLAAKWEKKVLSHFDKVSTISHRMVALLLAKGVSKEKAVYFPNWVNTEQIHPVTQKTNTYRNLLNISDKAVLVLYSGNMGVKQGLNLIIEVAELLRDNPDIVFLLCGNGAARTSLERSAEGLGNIKFLDLQPLENLNELLNAADIHLVPQQANAADLVMPSKLLGMLASGKPIIATAAQGTELADLVSKIGKVVAPGDPGALSKAILEMANSKIDRVKFGREGRNMAVENWDQDLVLSSFMDQVESLINVKLKD